MKTYIGTKVIKAKPMTKKEYCDYRGWKVPPGEDPTEEIMLVEYEPDPKSEPNHPDHEGYISMSPMHVFEEAYKPADTFEDRLKIEYQNLTSNIDKLSTALVQGKVPEAARPILTIQLVSMKDYATVLAIRLGLPQEVSFAVALEALKQGKKVARVGWNGKGMFAFKQVHADITMDIVPNMQSVPQDVKDEIMHRETAGKEHANIWGCDPIELNTIRYRNQFCIVYPDNTIYAWVPSANDICNDDWIILD